MCQVLYDTRFAHYTNIYNNGAKIDFMYTISTNFNVLWVFVCYYYGKYVPGFNNQIYLLTYLLNCAESFLRS